MRGTLAFAGGFLTLVLAFGIFGDKAVVPRQGDQLGPDNGQPRQEYLDQAASLLADAASDKHASTSRFALVSFAYPVDAAHAADAVAPAPRANALVPLVGQVRPLPEPAGGENRSDVIGRALELEAAAGASAGGPAQAVSGLVVYADAEQLQSIATNKDVAAVEPAPLDAAWGSFAVRPLGAASLG